MIDINEIGATAFVIASIRALEDENPEPLFSDPYAAWFSNERARAAARQLDVAFPPSTTMVRFRTRYFNRFVERGGLAEFGFDPHAPTLIIWEGNTMYLPPESIMPFLNRLADAMSSFRMAFDYFALDLQNREFADSDDRRRLEDMERAMGASFSTGFPDLTVFEQQAPFRVAEAGSFSGLAEEYGTGHIARSVLRAPRRAGALVGQPAALDEATAG